MKTGPTFPTVSYSNKNHLSLASKTIFFQDECTEIEKSTEPNKKIRHIQPLKWQLCILTLCTNAYSQVPTEYNEDHVHCWFLFG